MEVTTKELGRPPVHHTYRERNRMADLMAKRGSQLNCFDKLHVFVTPPASIGVVFGKIILGDLTVDQYVMGGGD